MAESPGPGVVCSVFNFPVMQRNDDMAGSEAMALRLVLQHAWSWYLDVTGLTQAACQWRGLLDD